MAKRSANAELPSAAELLQEHREEAGRRFGLSDHVLHTLRTLGLCRTAALGGHAAVCTRCLAVHPRYNACRNRHCPQCQGARRAQWAETETARMLAAPHFMVVFTLPGVLRPLAKANPDVVYDALMKASADTLAELARLKYDARLGVTTVLHTWTREMTFHPHVHALVSSVGLASDGSIVRAKKRWLFSRKALARCFRAKFVQRLVELARDGLLDLGRWSIATWSQKANNTAFVVHVEPPLGRDTAGVVRYLAQYVYNIAISDSRILAVTNATVTIAGRNGPVTMDRIEFVRRWSMHVLPKGFRKVRHTGLYAPGNGALLAQAKAALGNAFPPRTVGGEPPDEPTEVAEPWTCEDCGATEHVTVDLKSLSDVLAILSRLTPCPVARGPP